MWVEDLPEVAVEIVRNNRLQPGVALVKLASEVTRPSFKELGLSKQIRTTSDQIQFVVGGVFQRRKL